jgi:hypothetical protein
MKFKIKKVYALLICEVDGEEKLMGIEMPQSVTKALRKRVDSL